MANNMLNAFNFTMEPREPLTLKPGYVKNLNQEMEKNIIKSENVTFVNFVYLTILSTIVFIGFIIFWVSYRRQNKPDLIQEK
jgi:hypothetical protein